METGCISGPRMGMTAGMSRAGRMVMEEIVRLGLVPAVLVFPKE
jgi:hypothetical protein